VNLERERKEWSEREREREREKGRAFDLAPPTQQEQLPVFLSFFLSFFLINFLFYFISRKRKLLLQVGLCILVKT
jgi:hypothetical protein